MFPHLYMTKLPYIYYNLVIFLTFIEAHTILQDINIFRKWWSNCWTWDVNDLSLLKKNLLFHKVPTFKKARKLWKSEWGWQCSGCASLGPGCESPAPTEEVSPATSTCSHNTMGGGHRLAGLAVFQPSSKFSERVCPKGIRQEMIEQGAGVPVCPQHRCTLARPHIYAHTHLHMHTIVKVKGEGIPSNSGTY